MARPAKGLRRGDDGDLRCWWCGDDRLYTRYHDREWGRPLKDDRRLFEKLCLEGFQAGLSWITILRKRERFRAAFAQFDLERVARFSKRDVNRLLGDEGIVRHRGKIESTINNARRAIELIEAHGSLAAWIWSYEPDASDRPARLNHRVLTTLTKTPASTAMSLALKQRGFSYVGPTTMYAMMQSAGLVNDHLEGCVARAPIERARQRFRRP